MQIMNYIKQYKNKFVHQLLILIVLVTSGLWLTHITQDQIKKNRLIKTEMAVKIDTERIDKSLQKSDTTNKTYVVEVPRNDQNLDQQLYQEYNNDIQSLGVILTAVISLLGIMLSYTQRGRFEKIDVKLERNNEEHQIMAKITGENYNNIIDGLKEVKDLSVRKDIITIFREITNGYTRMAPQNIVKPFIDAEGERLVTFAEEIMNERFTAKVQDQAIVKIDYTIKESQDEAKLLFGESFQKGFRNVSDINNERLKNEILKIASDEVNNKYARFKNVCETFLHTHLLDIIKLSLTLKIK